MYHGLHHSLSLWVTLRQLQKHHRTGPRVARQTCDHLHPAHSKAGAVRRDLPEMWGQVGWAMPCPRVPALLLLVVGTGVSTQDICSSRADGTLQAPSLFLNASSAQEGDIVLARCVLQKLVPATRIVFCKDGLEVHSVKAKEGSVINSMLLSITERSSGTYTCLYEQRNQKNWLRSSALSAPWHLQVTGHVSGSTEGTPTADLNIQQDPTVIAVATVALTFLISAATFWAIKKGACRGKCRSAEESPADHASDYVNVDETRRVKASRMNSSEVCT